MSNNYDDDQSEDGELARSPIHDDLDFSLSDDDRDHPDALVIKPPQAIVRPSHRERRAHKKSLKERHKDSSRKDKKQLYRDREKSKRELGKSENDEMSKEYYREKQYYKEKERYRDREKDLRDKEMYKEKESREKDIYRGTKEKDGNREKDFRDKDAYRDKEMYRDREMYKDTTRDVQYREMARQRDKYKEELFADKYKERDRELYMSREQMKYMDGDRRPRKEQDRIESRLRQLAEDSHQPQNNEKENRDRTTGDKELEDLRSRLLSKRINKDNQQRDTKKYPQHREGNSTEKETKTERGMNLDKNQEERRKRLIQADREMEKRKYESRTELEARREERRRRGKRRSVTPEEANSKKSKMDIQHDDVVTVSDTSDVEMKSDASEQEEGEHTRSEMEEDDEEEESTSSDSDSDGDTKSAESNGEKGNYNENEGKDSDSKTSQVRHSSKSPARRSDRETPSSNASKRSRSRSKSRSRSRSHSFSPPPLGEKPPTEDKTLEETDEDAKRREEKLSALPPYFPALQGCRSVEEFQCLNRIEEGTYGVVYRARDKTTEEIVALKRLKMEKEKEGFPITSLREINTLLKGQHPNIVTVREIVVGSNMDKIFIVMDYVEHDLKSLMETMRAKKQVFLPGEVKCLMTQLLKAVFHLHDNWILHRDLKTSNLLLSHKGVLKVGDFGLAREYGSPLRQYTPVVVTLWYRAPELLLCTKEYSTAIDIWSVGCIFAEFITMHPLFPGKSEVDQLNRIFKDLGTPSESVWTGYSQLPAVQKMTFAEHPAGGLRQRVGADLLSETGLNLLQGLLTYDPVKRLSADAALDHAYFKEPPVAIDPAMFPTWPAKSEGGRRSTQSPRPPAGGGALRDSDEPPAHFRLANPPRSINVAPGFSLKF